MFGPRHSPCKGQLSGFGFLSTMHHKCTDFIQNVGFFLTKNELDRGHGGDSAVEETVLFSLPADFPK